MACPDGCGSILTVNLDPRAGKAWRLYDRGNKTLFPSVWRDSGCEAHFIVWRDRILWCGVGQSNDGLTPTLDPDLEARVIGTLGETARFAGDIAQELDAIPYDVEHVLSKAVRSGHAQLVATRPAGYRVMAPTTAMTCAGSTADIAHEKSSESSLQTPAQTSWWRRLLRR